MSEPRQGTLDDLARRLERLVARRAGGDAMPAERRGDALARLNAALEALEALEGLEATCGENALREFDAFRGADDPGKSKTLLKLAEGARLSASILACAPQSIIVADLDGRIALFSPGAEAMLGYRAAEMLGASTLLLHDPEEVRARARELSRELGVAVPADFSVFVTKTRASGRPEEREWTYVRQDGTRITVLLSMTTLRDARGRIDGFLGVASDITERTLALAEISRMAHHDQLTRLPNRRLFHDRMQMAISHARRETGRLALMLIDLDGFKPVNDRLGHAVGDLLLKAVAKRMQGALRESDTLARVGGDEFAVILPRVENSDNALVVAEKIRREIDVPFELAGGYPVSISCSIGIAIYPEHGREEKRLAKHADEAMYIAKAHGGNCTRLSNRAPAIARQAPPSEPLLLKLVWEKEYQCGEPAIDQTRHEIFGRANELIQSLQSEQYDARQLHAALDAFIACVARNLASEEAVLAQHHYSALAEHALLHQKLVGRSVELFHRLGDVPTSELVSFLAQDIVVGHLLREDRLFSLVFGHGVPVDVADAVSDER
jgi:diguanylate cyclase (GGDEF)-like protein/hemerythrin-like metal-binding protein